MKLRIHGNSLRLRLSSSEIEQLQSVGHCTESLRFGPDSQLTYRVETSPECTAVDTEYRQDCIRITLPLNLTREWAKSDQVSLSVNRSDGPSPSVLIEKDLPCRHDEGRISNNVADRLARRAEE